MADKIFFCDFTWNLQIHYQNTVDGGLKILYVGEVTRREKKRRDKRRKELTYKDIRENREVLAYLKKGNDNLGTMGFTDHSGAHCAMVAERAAMILEKFGYSEHDREVAKIAGFMHDMGNAINRHRHAEYGALLAEQILSRTDLPLEDRVTVVTAIGNHDESHRRGRGRHFGGPDHCG